MFGKGWMSPSYFIFWVTWTWQDLTCLWSLALTGKSCLHLQMSWFTRRRSSKPFLMNLTKPLLKCQDTKIKIQVILSFSNFYFFLSSCFLFQKLLPYYYFQHYLFPLSSPFSHGSFFTGDFMLKSNFQQLYNLIKI